MPRDSTAQAGLASVQDDNALADKYADAVAEEHQHMCCLKMINLPRQTYLQVMYAAERTKSALADADIV